MSILYEDTAKLVVAHRAQYGIGYSVGTGNGRRGGYVRELHATTLFHSDHTN
jgi:hypothetical protein